MNKLSFLFLFLAVVYSDICLGQYDDISAPTPPTVDQDYLKEQTPTSPEAASLGNYGDISNNPYNGKASVGINLHTLDFDGLSIPLSLNYDTGGLRVDADASWVGLNWTLSGTASITRKIYGNDDLNEGFVPNHLGDVSARVFSDIDVAVQNGEVSMTLDDVERVHTLQTNSDSHSQPDLAADIYTVSVFGKSYSFYLERREGTSSIIQGYILNDKYATIVYNLDYQSFELKDSRGFTYFFNTKNYTATASSANSTLGGDEDGQSITKEFTLQGLSNNTQHGDNTVISSWNLDRIDSPDGNSIFFAYQEGAYFTTPQYSGQRKIAAEGSIHDGNSEIGFVGDFLSAKFTSSLSIIHAQYLSSITGDFGAIQFVSSDDRRDLLSGSDLKSSLSGPGEDGFRSFFTYITKTGGGQYNHIKETHGNTTSTGYNLLARKLNQILVKDPNNRVVKEIDFQQSYYNSNRLGTPDEALYLRLKLDEVQINEKKYSFEYQGTNQLPNKMTFSKDFWGFYNGANNESNVPGVGRFMAGISHNFVYEPPMSLLAKHGVGTDHIPYGPEDLGMAHSVGEYYFEFRDADLSSNFNFGNRGNLNRIFYPTGGYTEIEYEPNEVLVDATLPYVVEDYYPNKPNMMRWTSLRNEDNYNFTYLYLKYATDPDYSLFENRYEPTTSETGIALHPSSVASNNGEFTVEYLSVITTAGFLVTYTGTDNYSPTFEDVPVYYVENVHHPEIVYPIYTYGDWYESPQVDPDFGQKSIVIPPGTYRLKQDFPTPPGARGVGFSENSTGGPTGDFTLYEGTIDGIDGFAGAEIFEVGGARVKSITNYDNTNAFVSKKAFAYNFANADFDINTATAIPSGKLMDDLMYHSKLGFFSYIPFFGNIVGADNGVTAFSSNNLLGQSGSAQGSHIGYSEVTEYSLDASDKILGAYKRSYSNKPNEYYKESASRMFNWILDYSQNDLVSQYRLTPWENSIILNLPPEASFDYSNGQVLQEEWYSCNGEVTKQITNSYENIAINASDMFNVSFWSFPYYNGDIDHNDNEASISSYHWFRMHQTYYTYGMPNYLAKESKISNTISIDFSDQGALPSQVAYYEYDEQGNLFSNFVENSQGEEEGTVYYYPYSNEVFSSFGTNVLRTNNMYSQVVKSERYANNQLLGQTALSFLSNGSTSSLPKAVASLQAKGSNTLEERKAYELYNDKGRLVQTKASDGTTVSYLWGYNDQYVVAVAQNAPYSLLASFKNDIDLLSSQDDDSCGYNGNCSEAALRNALSNLRDSFFLREAQVSTYTYNPLVGVTSSTQPNGVVSYYSYDTFGRLTEARDKDGKLISQTEYNINSELLNTLGIDALGISECGEVFTESSPGDDNSPNGPIEPSDEIIIANAHNNNSPNNSKSSQASRNENLDSSRTKMTRDGIVNGNYKFAPLNVDLLLEKTTGDGNIIDYTYKARPYGGSGDVEYRWKIKGQAFTEFKSSNEWSYKFICRNESVRGLAVICEIRDKKLGITYRDEIRHVVLCNR